MGSRVKEHTACLVDTFAIRCVVPIPADGRERYLNIVFNAMSTCSLAIKHGSGISINLLAAIGKCFVCKEVSCASFWQ